MADEQQGGFWSGLGAGLQSAGGILSPQVYEAQQQDRANALTDIARKMQITKATNALRADAKIKEALQGVKPGMTSSAMLEAIGGVDQATLAESNLGPAVLQRIAQQHTQEVQTEQQRRLLQDRLDQLNKPTEHFDATSGKIIRSYRDGRTEVIQVESPRKAAQTRTRIAGDMEIQEEYDPEAKKWKEYGRGPRFAKQVTPGGGGPSAATRDYDAEYKKLDQAGQTALDMQAWNYIQKSVLPYRKGSGGGADRNDPIIHRAGQIANELGMTAQELSGKSAEFKSNAQALAGMTKKLNAVQATLESFHNNIATWESIAEGEVPKLGGAKLSQIRDQLKKVDLSDVKTLADWQLKIRQQFNDPSAIAYVTAAFTVAMDYSRIISSQGQSAAAVTEGARNEALKLVAAGYNANSRKALIGTLESDAAGQIKGQETQVNRLRKKLGLRDEPSTAEPGGSGAKEDPLGIRR